MSATKVPTIPQALKSAVNAYLLARTLTEVEREKVDAIQRRVLAQAAYRTDPKWVDREGETITEPDRAYLLCDSDHTDYLLAVRQDLEAAGYDIKGAPGEARHSYFCPALQAETLQTETEHAVIDAVGEMLREGPDFRHKLLCVGLDKYHEFVELCVKLVVNLPGFKPPTIVTAD